jgi:signal transduction histidine kinase
VEAFREQNACAVTCDLPEQDPRADGAVSLALYRILQESLVNVAKHARASAVRVALRERDGWIELEVADDGTGVSEQDLAQAARRDHLGVSGMRERAELLGGSFTLESVPARGTTARALLPAKIG